MGQTATACTAKNQRAFSIWIGVKYFADPLLRRGIVRNYPVRMTPMEGPMAINIARRKFIAALGGTAFARPLAVRAEQTAMPVVGFLSSRSPDESTHPVAAFRTGLQTGGGFVEGRNVAIEYLWAEGQYGRLPEMGVYLVRRGVAVIAAAGGEPSALAAKGGDVHNSNNL